jgi:hypothetical protein
MNSWRPMGALIGIVFMTACTAMPGRAPAEERQIPVTVLYSSTQCGSLQAPGATADWIERPGDLILPGFQGDDAKNLPALQWDPATEGVLRIRMGSRPTGGYALEPAGATAQVIDRTALIRIKWRKPEPGMMVTQAFTSPCLLLKVPRQGLDTIRVIDQQDRVRAEIPVP